MICEQNMRLIGLARAMACTAMAALVITNAARAEQRCFDDWSPQKAA